MKSGGKSINKNQTQVAQMLELVDKRCWNSYYRYTPYVQEHDEKMNEKI